MPRRELTLADKIAILDEIRRQPPNTSNRQLEAITGVPKSTIGRLIHQQDKLLEQWALSKGHRGATQKRKRDGKDPEVEEALVKWLSIVTERGLSVNGPMLKSKSEELAKKLGRSNFKATDGWLSRLKSRHGIKFHKARTGKTKDTGDHSSSAEKLKSSTQLPNLLQKFCADDIYNAVETGLLYRATPDGSLRYKHEALLASDRVTILCCSNMSGTDKRKLLVIGTYAEPPCFKGLAVDSLPVLYYDNRNAWMTSEIFKDWLVSWDAELRWASRKVLLLLENCAAHPRLDCLENIRVEFLPAAKTTALLPPMDMGIVQNLKALYRGRLVNYILEAIEEKRLTPSSKAAEVSAKVDLLRAVQFLADSWREVSGTTVQNCFARYGFQLSGLEMADCENEAILEFQHVVNFEEFASVDTSLQCYGENDNFEDEIIEQIAAKHLKTEEVGEGDRVVTPDPVEEVTNVDARKYVAGLRRYFMQRANEGGPMSALDVCADFVHQQSVKRTGQGTLDKFLQPS